MKLRITPRLTRLAAATALAGGIGVGLLTAAPASASPGQTVHGDAMYGQVVVDFLPIDSPPGISLPSSCWFPANDAIMSVSGNGIQHGNGNKTGFWFTSTYTGTAAVYPIVFSSPGVPQTDPVTGNDVLDTTGTPAATGHLTIWFGAADNLKNSVNHATLTFTGADSSGNPVSMHAHFQFATNAAGNPTAVLGSVTC